MMSRKMVVYVLLIISVVTLLASLYTGATIPFLFPLNLILVLLTLALWKFGYLLSPIIGRFISTEIKLGQYTLMPGMNAIYRKVDDQYYVSKFLSALIYESTTEKTEAEKTMMMEYFERAITSFKYPVKISLLIRNIDLTKELDNLRADRSRLEIKKSNILSDNAQSPEVAVIERKIAMLSKELERLTTGDRPMQTVCLIMTTSKGASIDEARLKADSRSKEIQAVIGNALGVQVMVLYGEEMLKCFDFQYFIPVDSAEFTDIFE